MNGTIVYRSMLAAVAVVVMSACSTLNVRSDSDAAANLGSCHTYSWVQSPASSGPPDAFDNPLNDKRLRDAIAQRLHSRGLSPAVSGSGDCQVAYAFGTRTTAEALNRPRVSFGIGTGWGGWGRSRSAGSIYWDSTPYAVNESRLSIDLFKTGGPAGRDPLWHASVDTDFTRLTGAEAEKRIDAVVAALFTTYPTTK